MTCGGVVSISINAHTQSRRSSTTSTKESCTKIDPSVCRPKKTRGNIAGNPPRDPARPRSLTHSPSKPAPWPQRRCFPLQRSSVPSSSPLVPRGIHSLAGSDATDEKKMIRSITLVHVGAWKDGQKGTLRKILGEDRMVERTSRFDAEPQRATRNPSKHGQTRNTRLLQKNV